MSKGLRSSFELRSRCPAACRVGVSLDSPILPGRKRVPPAAVAAVIKPPVAAFADITRQALLNHFAAGIVLIDRKGQIMQFYGQTGKYLNMPLAEPNLNLFEMAKEGLSIKLRSALHKTIETDRKVTMESVSVTRDKGSPYVRITIAPVKQSGDSGQLFAVIFEDVSRPATPAAEQHQTDESETAVKHLEDELISTRQELQVTIEELQASNEELRVSNEEVVSTNEELQSTIEELETSKEELQSVNEELSIVNSQLQEKVEKLDAANSDISNFLKATDIATLFLGSDLRIKLFTPATMKVLKLIPSDTGRPIEDLSSDLTGFDLLSDARAVAGGESVVVREVQHADGSHYLVRIMPYRTPKDEIDGVIVTFSDVTILKQAEKQTRRLAAVVKGSNDAVLLLDKEGNILAWNRGARDLYGWSEEEALQMNINDMTPRNNLSETSELIRRLVAGTPILSFETQRKTKDGRILDIWLTATAVRDGAEKVEALATTERDITERKKGFDALNRELKLKVSELVSANAELEAFNYSVSHDLRAPLRHMSSFSTMLQAKLADSTDEQTKKYLALIIEASKKMAQLIDDLLSFSHIGRAELQKRRISLNSLLKEIIREMQDDLKDRKIRWEIDELPDVLGDKSLLKLAMVNLVSNAVKYTRTRLQAEIKIRCKDSDDHFTCSITDNGVGFDTKYSDRLFGVFQRLHPDSEFEGTGIGLANVKSIILRHGGKTWAESKEGQGSTFYFTLPKVK